MRRYQIVKGVSVRRAEAERRVVALLGLDHLTLFLERVRQIAVGIWEVRLELDRAPVCVDRKIDEPGITTRMHELRYVLRVVLSE